LQIIYFLSVLRVLRISKSAKRKALTGQLLLWKEKFIEFCVQVWYVGDGKDYFKKTHKFRMKNE
jgi:hypothetical protein